MGAAPSRWQCRLPAKCGGKLECESCKLESGQKACQHLFSSSGGTLYFRGHDEEEVEIGRRIPWALPRLGASSPSDPPPPKPEKVQLPGGATYQGSWLGEEKHGEGLLALPGGARYEGQFRHDRRWGHGTYTASCGSVCSGQWVADRQHGHGTERWADGSRFDGEYSGGEKFGAGLLQWANGCTFEGQFARSMMHGQGSYTWQDGRRYSGQWVTNVMGPTGRMSWPDGRIYIGDICDGRSHGRGTLRWPDGRSYCGQWREGRQHGEGVVRTVKGMECTSLWKEGKFEQWTDMGYFHPPDGTLSCARASDAEITTGSSTGKEDFVGKAAETPSTVTPPTEAASARTPSLMPSSLTASPEESPPMQLRAAAMGRTSLCSSCSSASDGVSAVQPVGQQAMQQTVGHSTRNWSSTYSSEEATLEERRELPEELEVPSPKALGAPSGERSPELVPEPAMAKAAAAPSCPRPGQATQPAAPSGSPTCGCLALLRLLPAYLRGPRLRRQGRQAPLAANGAEATGE